MKNLNKKYQVFVSSTYLDLLEERNAVMSTLLKSDCIPAGMELFPASDDDQWSLIKKVIDESDYYVVIIAGKYGSEYKGKSFTQMEYEYALSKKKSIIAFIHGERSKLIAKNIETDPEKQKKLEEFIRLAKRKVCKYWHRKEELSLELYHAIDNLKKTNKKDGWIRATPWNLRKLSENRNKSLKSKNERLSKRLEKAQQIIDRLKLKKSDSVNVSEYIDIKIKVIDKEINDIYPGKFYSPAKRQYEKFSSRKLINSLSSIGIPIEACFEIIESVIILLKKQKSRVSQVSTNHIREKISFSLYSYSRAGAQLPFDWEDKYIRRYGNPERRIMVLLEDGSINPLTFKYIKYELLPCLFEDILIGIDSKRFLQTLRHNERAIAAETILDTVKLVEMELIDFITLFNMSKTIMLRRPHPWISEKPFDKASISYDFDRCSRHFSQIRSCFTEDCGLSLSIHSVREFIHHSCSGILTIYGSYKGARFMSSLDYLINNLTKLSIDKGSYLFQYSSFKSISHDLKEIGTNSDELLTIAKRIKLFIKEGDLLIKENSVFTEDFSYLYKSFVSLIDIYIPDLVKDIKNDL